jgi:hypothetical protein
MTVPNDMKPDDLDGLIGDSFRHREAYSNSDIHIFIVSEVLLPQWEDELRRRRIHSCDTPDYLLKRSTYQESVIEIDGRKAKLGIERNSPPKSSSARPCVPSMDDKAFELLIAANCKDDRALETVYQIFDSLRFSDTH